MHDNASITVVGTTRQIADSGRSPVALDTLDATVTVGAPVTVDAPVTAHASVMEDASVTAVSDANASSK